MNAKYKLDEIGCWITLNIVLCSHHLPKGVGIFPGDMAFIWPWVYRYALSTVGLDTLCG